MPKQVYSSGRFRATERQDWYFMVVDIFAYQLLVLVISRASRMLLCVESAAVPGGY